MRNALFVIPLFAAVACSTRTNDAYSQNSAVVEADAQVDWSDFPDGVQHQLTVAQACGGECVVQPNGLDDRCN